MAAPTREFVVSAEVDADAFDAGLAKVSAIVEGTLTHVDQRGDGGTLQMSWGRADVETHGSLEVARFGVAPAETRDATMILHPTTFMQPCEPTCGGQDAWTLRFEHLGGGPVRVTWAVRALYDTSNPAEDRPIQITATDLGAVEDAP